MSKKEEFETKYPVTTTHSMTTDEYISCLGFSVDDDGEIIDEEGKGTGFYYSDIEY